MWFTYHQKYYMTGLLLQDLNWPMNSQTIIVGIMDGTDKFMDTFNDRFYMQITDPLLLLINGFMDAYILFRLQSSNGW